MRTKIHHGWENGDSKSEDNKISDEKVIKCGKSFENYICSWFGIILALNIYSESEICVCTCMSVVHTPITLHFLIPN